MNQVKADIILDAKGLACPMPIVKTRKAVNDLESGQVLEVQATDPGSKADIKAWAESSGHQYLGTIEEKDLLKHFLRKSSKEEKEEMKHPEIINNEELEKQLQASKDITVLDVREAAEFMFNHIPDAINIPLGELEGRVSELNSQDKIYIVCRTGNRSDMASRKLTELGFSHVYNVVPGMTGWSGETRKLTK